MTACTATRGVSLLRVALLVTTGLVLSMGTPAWARVGVTSGADGDPLGKPPNENERVLRIGIDVQANELITTAANDRAHLVFLDGSALTVGPNAQLTIDRFVYDPSTQKGELAINASKGVLRLVGGKISKTNAITIVTPSSTIGIRGGITVMSVTQVQTIANFVFGSSMTVTAGGQTQTATRAGSQVTTNAGGVPGFPILYKNLIAALSQLEGGNSNNNNSADQSAQSSGFSGKNSGQPPTYTPNFKQNGPPNTTNNTLTNTVSNTNPAGQPASNSTPQNQKTPTTTTSTTTTSTTTTPTTTTPTTTTPTTTTPTTTTPKTTTTTTTTTTSGPTRTSQTLTGFSSGVTVTLRRVDGEYVSVPDPQRLGLLKPGQISITTDAANRQAKATIVVHDFNSSHHDYDHHQSSTATFQLGGNGFADDKTYVIGTSTDSLHRSTLRTGDHTRRLNDATLLASAGATPVPLPSNPGCTCEFLSWGSWASIVPDAHDSSKATGIVGNYIVGRAPLVPLPMTGSATYTGFMSGIAQQGSNPRYAATGSYQNMWNFQNGRGAFTGNFDGKNYSGMTYGTGGTTFAGNFNSSGGYHRSGSLSGGFFSSPSDMAGHAPAYQAGTFSIGSARSYYQATGIFAGQRP